MTDDYARTHDYFRAVAAVLLAGDIQARLVSNSEHPAVEVLLIDGSRVLWSNARQFWGYTIISPNGTGTSDIESLPWDVDVEDAAKMIAMHDYPAPAAYPV